MCEIWFVNGSTAKSSKDGQSGLDRLMCGFVGCACRRIYIKIYYVCNFDFRNLKWWAHKYECEFIPDVCSVRYHIQWHELKFILGERACVRAYVVLLRARVCACVWRAVFEWIAHRNKFNRIKDAHRCTHTYTTNVGTEWENGKRCRQWQAKGDNMLMIMLSIAFFNFNSMRQMIQKRRVALHAGFTRAPHSAHIICPIDWFSGGKYFSTLAPIFHNVVDRFLIECKVRCRCTSV